MLTDLPAGTVFVQRFKGRDELWEVIENGPDRLKMCAGRVRQLKPGDVIHRGVWVGPDRDTLESRGTYTLKEGDVEWTKQATLVIGGVASMPIEGDYRNVFAATVPAWLRGAE